MGQSYPKISWTEIWLRTGCVSLAQNEAETSAAGLEAQFNRLESNRGMENGVKTVGKTVKKLLNVYSLDSYSYK